MNRCVYAESAIFWNCESNASLSILSFQSHYWFYNTNMKYNDGKPFHLVKDWNYNSKLKAMTYRYLGAAGHQWLLWKGKSETHVNHLNFKRISFTHENWDDLNLYTSLSFFDLCSWYSFITSSNKISAWYKTKSCWDRIDMMNMTIKFISKCLLCLPGASLLYTKFRRPVTIRYWTLHVSHKNMFIYDTKYTVS